MKAKGIRTFIIRGVLLVLLSLYFLVVFAQKSPNLISFDATRKADNISLQWLLTPSNNLSAVIIEKKSTDNSYRDVAMFWVNMEGNTTCNFTYTDKKVKSKNTQYRLKLVTDKGEVQYSDFVSGTKRSTAQSAHSNLQDGEIAKMVLVRNVNDSELIESLKAQLVLRLIEKEQNYL